jgi:DNA-directed RNA polymerase specialized sigma24 family protein
MYFFGGYSLLEISQELGHPLGSVRNYYYRGLEQLRKKLLQNGSLDQKGK